MIKSLLKKLTGAKLSYLKIRSFTYFIPAPPSRKKGYQEKEIDSITNYFLENDLDIITRDIKVLNTEKSSGAWIFFTLGAKTKEAVALNLDIEYGQIADHNNTDIKLDPMIVHDDF